jgi:hypothetical protein
MMPLKPPIRGVAMQSMNIGVANLKWAKLKDV